MRKQLSVIGFILLVFALFTAGAQTIKILSVDPSGYPKIVSEFKAIDANGKDLRNFTKDVDLTVLDGGKARTTTNITCPENISAFSLILIIDRTQSMVDSSLTGPVSNAAKALISKLPAGRSECSIIVFSSGDRPDNPQLVHDWSVDKTSLTKSINTLKWGGATDYNTAFFGTPKSPIGALALANRARYKPVFIFLTDGGHNASDKFKVNEVVDSVKKMNGTIFCIALGELNGADQSMADMGYMSSSTQGDMFRNITAKDVERVYLDILARADAANFPPPCKIEWITGCDGGNLELKLNPPLGPASATFSYVIPDSLKPFFEVVNHSREFLYLNVDPTQPPGNKDIDLTIRVRNNSAKIESFVADSRWTLIDPPLPMQNDLPKDGTLNLKIRYTPNDSLCHESNAVLEGTACNGKNLRLLAGYVFAKNIDMGSVNVNSNQNKVITQEFCNWTCEPITIKATKITGTNATEFNFLNGASAGTILQPGECKDIEFSFAPKEEGDRSGQIEISITGNNIPSDAVITAGIKGYGRGNPDLIIPSRIDFPNADCLRSRMDTLISAINPGGSPLVISDITLIPQQKDGFIFNGPQPNIQVPENGGKTDLSITFAPREKGYHESILRITSNARSGAVKDIILAGTLDSIDIKPSVPEIDFGVVCPDSLLTLDFDLINDGNVAGEVTLRINPPYSLTTNIFSVQGNGGKQTVSVSLNGQTEGEFNSVLNIKDNKCGYEHAVNLKARIAAPLIDTSSVTITTNIGAPKQGTIKIRNKSGRNIKIADLIPQDAQFKVISQSSNIIPAGGEIDVVIEYTPNPSGVVVRTKLELYGSPCNFRDLVSLDLIGNPDKSFAIVHIDTTHKGLIGDVVQIPVQLRGKIQFAQSQTATINTGAKYNPLLLQAVSFTPANATVSIDNQIGLIDLKKVPVSQNNNDEVIGTISFRVLDALPLMESALEIQPATSDKGTVQFNTENGKFTVLPASAVIFIDTNLTANPGDVFDLKIFLAQGINLSNSVHKSISTDLIYNASLFEPWESTPKGTFDQAAGTRTIALTGLQMNESAVNPVQIGSFKFRAMLGTALNTGIQLSNTKAGNGYIQFVENSGRFTLRGVCQSGNVNRLFNPYGKSGILSLDPNPSEGTSFVRIYHAEEGFAELTIVDMLGNEVRKIIAGDLNTGTTEFAFDASDLNSGIYFILFKTKENTSSRQFKVLK